MTAPLLFPIASIVADPPPPPLDGYAVLAYWQPGGWWKLWGDIWDTEDKGQEVAQQLPRGWLHRRILRVRIGEPEERA